MKSTISLTIDTYALQEFKNKYDNISGRINQLIKADINYKEPTNQKIQDKIIAIKTELKNLETIQQKETEEKEQKNKELIELK